MFLKFSIHSETNFWFLVPALPLITFALMECLFQNESSHPVGALKFLMFNAKAINASWSLIKWPRNW